MTHQPASTAPAAAAHPLVQGRCPACNGSSLFLGSGGYVTCARLDCPNPCAADDQLHRGRPDPRLRDHLSAALDTAFSDNYRPGVGLAPEEMADAALAALRKYLDIGEEEAWCKTCRRVWDGPLHRCESDADQRLAHAREVHQEACRVARAEAGPHALCSMCDALDQPAEQPARTTPNNPTTSKDQ